MPNGAARAAPSDNTRATRNTTTPPTPLSSRVMKGIRSTTTSDGEALSAELNIQARLTKTCVPTDRAYAAARRRKIHSIIYARRQLQALVRRPAISVPEPATACPPPANTPLAAALGARAPRAREGGENSSRYFRSWPQRPAAVRTAARSGASQRPDIAWPTRDRVSTRWRRGECKGRTGRCLERGVVAPRGMWRERWRTDRSPRRSPGTHQGGSER